MSGNNDKTVGEQNPVRKTIITKSCERTIWTAKYEGLKVQVQLEEEITWKDLNERQTKFDNVTKHLSNELVRTLNDICSDLGLENRQVFKDKDSKKDDVGGGAEVSGSVFDSLQ